MPTTPDPTGDLRIAIGQASRRIRAERGGAGLADPQYTVLLWLNKRGPLTPGQLAELERIQPPSMTRTVNCLEEAGYVERHPHETDRRQVVIALSERGSAILAADRRRRDAWLAKRLRELTPEERSVLRQAAPLIERLAQA